MTLGSTVSPLNGLTDEYRTAREGARASPAARSENGDSSKGNKHDAMISLNLVVHMLFAVLWVGGMFFAFMALRPVAAAQLESPQRLRLWAGVFKRFFPWVWLAVLALPVTGIWLARRFFGAVFASPIHVHIMLVIGVAMIMIFLHVFFAPYRRLRLAVSEGDWPTGGRALASIRRLVALNLLLGLTVVAVAAGGRVSV